VASPRIGIIGGSGFVGGELAKYCSKKMKVKVLDTKPPQLSTKNVCYEECDVVWARFSKV
jgi:nucleoside-diphosphate-sugar epimerase